MLRVGLDIQATRTDQPTGLAVTVNSLSAALQQAKADFEVVPLKGRISRELSTAERFWHDRFELPRLATQAGVDVLHQPAFSCPKWRGPVVWTVHDLRPITSNEGMSLTASLYWKEWLPASARNATKIVCTTEHVAEEVKAVLKVDPAKLEIIGFGLPTGVTEFRSDETALEDLRGQYQLTDPYFSCVATLQPIKNIPFLIRVFAALRRQLNLPHQLVVIGSKAWNYPVVQQAMAEEGLTENKDVVVTGFVSDADKWQLVSGSDAFLFPSLNEGYGLPPLEAQALGVPVISSNAGALPEVLGNGAIFATPTVASEWLSAYERLVKERETLIKAGRANSQRHSWPEIAAKYRSLYQQLAGN